MFCGENKINERMNILHLYTAYVLCCSSPNCVFLLFQMIKDPLSSIKFLAEWRYTVITEYFAGLHKTVKGLVTILIA